MVRLIEVVKTVAGIPGFTQINHVHGAASLQCTGTDKITPATGPEYAALPKPLRAKAFGIQDECRSCLRRNLKQEPEILRTEVPACLRNEEKRELPPGVAVPNPQASPGVNCLSLLPAGCSRLGFRFGLSGRRLVGGCRSLPAGVNPHYHCLRVGDQRHVRRQR